MTLVHFDFRKTDARGRRLHIRIRRRSLLAGLLMPVVVLALGGCGPSYQRLRLNAARAAQRQQFEESLTYLQQCHQRRPRDLKNLCDLGACHMRLADAAEERGDHSLALQNLDRAIGYYDRALRLDPAEPRAGRGLAQAQQMKGANADAIRQTEWSAEYVKATPADQLILARAQEQKGDIEGARASYRRAIALEPRNVELHREYGEFLIRQQRTEEARIAFRMVLQINPGDRGALEKLSQLEARAGG